MLYRPLNFICKKLWKYSWKVATPLFFLVTMASCVSARADEAKPDGTWQGSGGTSFSYSTGNSQSSSLAITADATRKTSDDKLSLSGQYVGNRAQSTYNGVTSTSTIANQWLVNSRYEYNITGDKFDFKSLEFSHNQIQLLRLRSVVSSGMGYHMIKTPESHWDLLGGVSYRSEQYNSLGVTINNQMVTGFDTVELLLSEDSSSKISETTDFTQHLSIRPNIGSVQGYLITFDSTLTVAINKTLSLRMTFQDIFNSLSQVPIQKSNTLFFTGINVKF
ncbi:MAG: DUF481 domain-containing protein [Gallionella sp.]|jgi:putative salt-induced outer membrane protein YdiY|nr:DUF481 domain-containing protein [Gallionella sp.]